MLAPFCISLGLFLSLQKHLAVRVIFNNFEHLSYFTRRRYGEICKNYTCRIPVTNLEHRIFKRYNNG